MVLRTFTAWGPTPTAKQWYEETVGKPRYEGIFTPPSLKGTLAYPGNVGGILLGRHGLRRSLEYHRHADE